MSKGDTDEVEMGEPEADGYRMVKRGEICPKCGDPGFRRTKHIGTLVTVYMIHSLSGDSFGGCIISEGLSDRYAAPCSDVG